MITLTQDQVDSLEQGLYHLDHDVDMKPAYSGRGMMGRTCLGIETTDTHRLMFDLGQWLATETNSPSDTWSDSVLDELAQSGFSGYRTDNMGYQYIVYFPGIEVSDG